MSKKAVLDIGSLKMKVAVFDTARRRLLSSDSHLTLLGKDLNETHLIHDSSLKMLEDALRSVAGQLERDGVHDVVIIGTEALRSAQNTHKVDALIDQFFPEHTLDIIPQDKEADLFFEAVSKEFSDTTIVAMDIGGGSVQIIKGIYDSGSGVSTIEQKYTLPTGTYKLQQTYSPKNDEISTQLKRAEEIIREAYTHIDTQASVLVFGSSVMADFIEASGVNVQHDAISENHTAYVSKESLISLLNELKALRPDARDSYYPDGGYFMYGADYLLMNIIAAADRIQPDKLYPTNLNTSYAFIETN